MPLGLLALGLLPALGDLQRQRLQVLVALVAGVGQQLGRLGALLLGLAGGLGPQLGDLALGGGAQRRHLALHGRLQLGDLVLAHDKLSVIVATAILCTVLWLFFTKTQIGTAMRATSENMLAAYYMGIPVKRVVSIVWAISAAVAGTAGVLLAPITFIHSNVGLVLGLKAFPAAVLGGFGSIPGALVGGVLIGVIESMAGFYLPQGWKDVAPYIVLLAVLLLKPEGLFGLHTRKKV